MTAAAAAAEDGVGSSGKGQDGVQLRPLLRAGDEEDAPAFVNNKKVGYFAAKNLLAQVLGLQEGRGSSSNTPRRGSSGSSGGALTRAPFVLRW